MFLVVENTSNYLWSNSNEKEKGRTKYQISYFLRLDIYEKIFYILYNTGTGKPKFEHSFHRTVKFYVPRTRIAINSIIKHIYE